ncbi:MAG TPA: hypothetical protein VGJ00_04805 [Rhabdochlamydiaceae bacterium]
MSFSVPCLNKTPAPQPSVYGTCDRLEPDSLLEVLPKETESSASQTQPLCQRSITLVLPDEHLPKILY